MCVYIYIDIYSYYGLTGPCTCKLSRRSGGGKVIKTS